ASAQADAVQRFGPSPRALAQRRALAVLVVVLIMVCAYGVLDGALLNLTGWIRWTLSILLLLALGRLFGAAIKKPLAEREVLLLPQALELRRGGFRRLVVFENIRHLHIVQNAAGRIWSLRLDLEDDSVSLRDVDGLAKIFTAAAQKRPAGVLIEVEELRVDWGEPLPWILSVLGAGIVALVALVV
ncbi:MAG TPA: hypothetical protein VFC44_04685, partial [Candidatus Saccharimonadales bacterium]|nr:hypothetical protein [Candidatus Saccharimonadales bacterium]